MAGEYVAWEEGFVDTEVTPGAATVYFAQDYAEANKLNQFYPQNGASWWENLAAYGATRAIDSHFAPSAVDKTAAGATYAGQNGRTYSAGAAQGAAGGNGMLLLVLAGVALVVLSS